MDQQLQYIRAIHDAYPDLQIDSVQLFQHGQFNDILLIDNQKIFRFPKTQREADKLTTEMALLRSLHDYVRLPIPDPAYQSQKNAPPGKIFIGYRFLSGEPLWPERLHALRGEKQIQHIANQLATFLQQLHTISAEQLGVQLPDFRGCEEWQDLYDRFRDKLFPFMRSDAHQEVSRQFEDFLSGEHNCNYTSALIHGDFGPSNILYDAQTDSISGIIDFSSARWGDPAVDFAAILCSVSYGEKFLERFADVYPGIEKVLPRTRFYAGTFALQEALYGLEDGNQAAFESGIIEYQ